MAFLEGFGRVKFVECLVHRGCSRKEAEDWGNEIFGANKMFAEWLKEDKLAYLGYRKELRSLVFALSEPRNDFGHNHNANPWGEDRFCDLDDFLDFTELDDFIDLTELDDFIDFFE